MHWRHLALPSLSNCKFPDPSNDESGVAIPGQTSFISYKTSLHDFCQSCGWRPPVYVTRQHGSTWTSKSSFGGHVYSAKESKKSKNKKEGGKKSPKQTIEQKAAYAALLGIGLLSPKSKFNIEVCIRVPCPGEESFVSYKCSLQDFCQQFNLMPPRYTTWKTNTGYSSMVQVGQMVSHTFNMPGHVSASEEVEQKAAFVALQELCLIYSQASYKPELCFTASSPLKNDFISYKSCLHDFCYRYNVPYPQYITTNTERGYTTRLKFGGLVFHTSDYAEEKRLISEQHAAYEALQGLGLLESTSFFCQSDFNRAKSISPPMRGGI